LDQTLKFENIKVGAEITPLSVRMDKKNYKLYNRMVKEINPLHFNKNYAKSLGFEDIVIAGVFTYSFFPKILVDWSQDPTSLKKITVRFNAPAYPGDIITHKGVIIKKYKQADEKLIECEVWAENQKGEKLTTAVALLSLK